MTIFDYIIGVLLFLWLGGLVLRIGGFFVHIFLILALISFIFRLLGPKG